MQDLSIYIHIPFCIRKCLYCDFLSMPAGESVREEYVQALCGEIREEAYHYKEHQVVTVFLGGGTPSLLSGGQLERIMTCVRENYRLLPDAEITMEMNPGTVTRQNLERYVAAGINRVSIGLQSAKDQELQTLGRIHTWEEFLTTFRLCREVGIRNINVDLMSALPGQTLDSWMETLEKTAALSPEHISAYSLIIEEGTPFYERYGEGCAAPELLPTPESLATPEPLPTQASLPDEETERQMYEQTKQFLEKKGYFRYEISNYAKPGMECAHNCVYWKRGDYVGFGVGAASMVANVRWTNVGDIRAYVSLRAEEKKEERQYLSRTEQMEETMFLGLRMTEGVSREQFAHLYDCDMDEVYEKVIKKHVKNGLLSDGKCLRLTDKGVDISNYVLADFLL